ncbi:MAG: hypothetical protein R2799_14275 [Crocinitomicaceae bacterium]
MEVKLRLKEFFKPGWLSGKFLGTFDRVLATKDAKKERHSVLESDAFRALDLMGDRIFSSKDEMVNFLEEHPGFVESKSYDISIGEVVDYLEESRQELKDNPELILMR